VKLHIVTNGKPKLTYAKQGWEEYIVRLRRLHDVRITHLADKYSDDAEKILGATGDSYRVGLIIEGTQLTSRQLATFLEQRALEGKELCFVIGGPDGLPSLVQAAMDVRLSFSKLTFPHDLAMIVLAEALYRASTINKGLPYHH
jgi:23S rRNA (pseudouridine1915-N3)-methyltransferase